jgi:ADP-ribose pyrophosphatase YjhB (NUDIX family)
MLPYLAQETQAELVQLAERYGQPLVHIANLDSSNHFDPLNKSDRYGEVCMVIRRPNRRLLTMKKTFYPPQAYRLLTGGIKHGERIYDALLREVHEETGLQTEVRRFLTLVAYRTINTGETPAFYTFAFLLDEVGGTLEVLDEDEHVEGFREVAPSDLPYMAQFLEHIKVQYDEKIDGNWGDWGQFRAVIHHQVWETLKDSVGNG